MTRKQDVFYSVLAIVLLLVDLFTCLILSDNHTTIISHVIVLMGILLGFGVVVGYYALIIEPNLD